MPRRFQGGPACIAGAIITAIPIAMNQFTPHGSPLSGAASAPAQAVPPVIFWFKVYAGGMALLYGLTILLGAFLVLVGTWEVEDIDPIEMYLVGGLLVGLGFVFLGLYVAALLLPRKPWVWVYDIVMIAIGLTSCLTMVAAIPLLIYWIKPEVQQYFGRNPAPAAGR